MPPPNLSVLLIGGGGVGAIAALNLETGGLATVTTVLRSNYTIVSQHGYNITSCDHGSLQGWKPSKIRNTIPNVTAENLPPYDYIVLATKNIPDIPPTLTELIAPAVTPGHTAIVLLQNGLNIEKPFFAAYPNNTNPIISGVSMIGSNEHTPGAITHDDHDLLHIGAFPRSWGSKEQEVRAKEAAAAFVDAYGWGRKTKCYYVPDVRYSRWEKLVYNACLNPICAITGLDTGRIRLCGTAVPGLVLPAMREIVRAAAAKGVVLRQGVAEAMVEVDPLTMYLPPSMLGDLRKGNFMEIENILGEPLREGLEAGVEMPVLTVLYELGRAIQWRLKEEKGLVEIPPKKSTVTT